MIQASVPEQADGGYWYSVDVISDPNYGGEKTEEIPGVGWSARYHSGVAVIRTPVPVAGVRTIAASPSDVLADAGYAKKPYERIGGS